VPGSQLSYGRGIIEKETRQHWRSDVFVSLCWKASLCFRGMYIMCNVMKGFRFAGICMNVQGRGWTL